MKILILAEQENGELKGYSKELASKAADLAAQGGGELVGVVIGGKVESAASALGGWGVSQVYAVQGGDLESYRGDAYAKGLQQVLEKVQPTIVLASASGLGKDILPRVAVRAKAGLATDCIDISLDGKKLKARRPLFSGKVLADVNFHSDVQMASVRPNSFPTKPAQAGGVAQVEVLTPSFADLPVKVKSIEKGESGSKDISEAEIVVSGGRAVGSAENFKVVRELAEALGGVVGASRAAVDAGYIGHEHQVGQTGKTVNPKLYIAAGISGAIQHLAGMRTSKVIVAINKDPEAPIFSKCDYGIVGDLFTLLPILSRKFKEFLGK